MKRKDGFTLIELLAVIIILGVLMLIAIPSVTEYISNSRKNAFISTAQAYITAVRNKVNQGDELQLYDENVFYLIQVGPDKNKSVVSLEKGGTSPFNNTWDYAYVGVVYTGEGYIYFFMARDESGQGIALTREDELYKMGGSAVAGNKPNFKAIYDGDGQEFNVINPAPVELTDAVNSVTTKIYPTIIVINKGYDNSIVKNYPNGTIVMFNPVTGQKCNDYVVSNSATGIKEGCLKWYAFDSNNGSFVKLILDHNTTAAVRWYATMNNTYGPITVTDKLNEDISSWNSSIKDSTRLITALEIASMVGNNTFTGNVNDAPFYFETGGTCTNCSSMGKSNAKYAWLFDRTGTTCETFGCHNNAESNPPRGYWTSTPTSGDTTLAWFVNHYGQVNANATVNASNIYGVRPVIVISKAILE